MIYPFLEFNPLECIDFWSLDEIEFSIFEETFPFKL